MTSVSNRCLSTTPYLSATSRRYSWISGCGENERDQRGLSSKEKEYRWDGHVAGRAGVGVVAPGAADLAAALDDEEVLAPVLGQPDRRAEAGEAAADESTPTCRRSASVPRRGRSAGGARGDAVGAGHGLRTRLIES